MNGEVADQEHPGLSDPAYRRRRDEIARISGGWERGQPIPTVDYTPAEDGVWETVQAHLRPLHARFAAQEYLLGAARLDLPTARMPQLADIDRRLRALSGFRMEPAPGLVDVRDFFGALAHQRFRSTQYVRHESSPLYTPEPDMLHEVIGHGNLLAHPVFADLHRAAGACAMRCETDAALGFFANVFWFTIEFGVVVQNDEPRAYGAGITSSYGEIQEFRNASLRPFDLTEMGTRTYDITHYQPVLFTIRSIAELRDRLGDFFDTFDDEHHARLTHASPAKEAS